MLFENGLKGVVMQTGNHPKLIVEDAVEEGADTSINGNKFLIHDPTVEDTTMAYLVGQLGGLVDEGQPTAMGVIRSVRKPAYHEVLVAQEEEAIVKKSKGSLKDLLYSGETWTVA